MPSSLPGQYNPAHSQGQVFSPAIFKMEKELSREAVTIDYPSTMLRALKACRTDPGPPFMERTAISAKVNWNETQTAGCSGFSFFFFLF